MLMKYSMSSSYRIGTMVSRKWDEDFSLTRTPNTGRFPRPTPWKKEPPLYVASGWLNLSEPKRVNLSERYRPLSLRSEKSFS
jgi:hypothetical protein